MKTSGNIKICQPYLVIQFPCFHLKVHHPVIFNFLCTNLRRKNVIYWREKSKQMKHAVALWPSLCATHCDGSFSRRRLVRQNKWTSQFFTWHNLQKKKTVSKDKSGTKFMLKSSGHVQHSQPVDKKHPKQPGVNIQCRFTLRLQLLISKAHSWSPTCITGVCFYTTVCFQCVSLINKTYNPSET